LGRKRKGDKQLGAGLDVEGYVVAGTEPAFEALAGAADDPRCIRCGSPIKYVFLTNKGPMGGDCLATVTGDPSTRKIARKFVSKLEQKLHYQKIEAIKLAPWTWGGPGSQFSLSAVSIDRNQYDSYSGLFGTRDHFLMTFPAEHFQLMFAVVANEAEARGLDFLIPDELAAELAD